MFPWTLTFGVAQMAGVRDAALARVCRRRHRGYRGRRPGGSRVLSSAASSSSSASRRVACLRHQRKPARAVAALGERLGRDRADARLRPRARRAGVERARLHGDAELAGLGVPPDDRVGHGLDDARPRAAAASDRLGEPLGDRDRREVRVGARDGGHDRGVCDDETVDAEHATVRSTTRPIPHVPAGWK